LECCELRLWIVGISDREYQASVLRVEQGLGGNRFVVPDDSRLLNSRGNEGNERDVRRRSVSEEETPLADLHKTGHELFQLVFRDFVGRAFEESLAEARRLDRWFHLRLTFENAPLAVEWPWEALVDATGAFLVLKPKFSIERIPVLSEPPRISPIPRDRKLRVLLAGASPADQPRLSVQSEKNRIHAAFKAAGVEIKVTLKTTRASLDKALSGRATFDLVHLIGHGDFDGKEGGLWLEGEAGKGTRLTSRELRTFLRRPLPFVFLNVCHSGRSSEAHFTGLAEGLLRSGVSAVLAMRRPITDQGAVDLAQAFYRGLAEGETLAQAVSRARQEARLDDGDWAVPILFLALADFAPLPREVVAPAPPQIERRRLPYALPRPFAALGTRTSRLAGPRTWMIIIASLIGVLLLMLFRWNSPNAPPVAVDPRCPSPEGLDLAFVFIPAGSFMQGADRGPKEEGPPHPVKLTHDFCLGAFEITRAQYAAVLGEPAPRQAESFLPQVGVSWEAAEQRFLKALQQREPEAGYRLPTEAEWEYAARAGTTTDYSFGDDPAALPQYANCQSKDGFEHEPAPVGSFAANAWGLYDMQGNVWEWTADSFSDYFAAAVTDPRSEGASGRKVRRGGAYGSAIENCRPTTRSDVLANRNNKDTGFRLVRTSVR